MSDRDQGVAEPGTPRGRFTPYGSRAFAQMWRHCQQTVGDFLRGHGYRVADAPRIYDRGTSGEQCDVARRRRVRGGRASATLPGAGAR